MNSQFGSNNVEVNLGRMNMMVNVQNLLTMEEDANYHTLGFETNLEPYNFQLPDFDDLSSPVQEKVPEVMINPSEKSPWHESDSGMSDAMSFVESPLGDDGVVLNPQHDFLLSDLIDDAPSEFSTTIGDITPLPPLTGFDEHFLGDADLSPISENHENESTESESTSTEQGTFSVLPKGNTRPVRKCVAERKWDVSDVLSCDSDDEPNIEPKSKRNGETNQIQDLKFFSGPNFPARSDIKILKVVKPTPGNIDASPDEIMKALDERSKKNARQAKINREKKKAYINSLESDIQNLKEENTNLVSENKQMKSDLHQLEDEVAYLKSVLANASALSGLLKNLNNVKEVKLSATITGRKRGSSEEDHTYNLVESRPAKRARMVRNNLRKAGVCLHVSEGEACLEFCAHCASLATKTHGVNGK